MTTLFGGPDAVGVPPSPHTAQVKVAQTTHTERAPERAPAHIRDVSLGGVNLVCDRPFQPGQILSLELPGVVEDGDHQVLACVVRSVPEPDGQWSLGCVFSRELSAEDLEKFGARKTKTPTHDQRTWVRFDCALKATYSRVGDPTGSALPAGVLNVSPSGVGLLIKENVEPGSLLNVHLCGKDGREVRTILACVVHSTLRASGDLALGCNFIRELAEEELQVLL